MSNDQYQPTGTGWPLAVESTNPPAPLAAEETTSGAPSSPAAQVRSPRRRLSVAGAVIGILLGLLGFALVAQLHSNAGEDQQLSAARPEDLVRLLSELDSRKDRINQEISSLQATRQQLAAGSQSRQAALEAARRRADELGILAGTLPAQGPGLQLRLQGGADSIKAADVLDAVEELRGAGAEAMQIAGANHVAVRIVAATSFVDGDAASLLVDGQRLTGPYLLTTIGEAATMRTALNIPGGVVDTVRHDGGNVTIDAPGTVTVTVRHEPGRPQYAQPTQ